MESVRTVGSVPAQVPLTATASDVLRVIVHGVIVADSGRLVSANGGEADRLPQTMLRHALAVLDNTPPTRHDPSGDRA